VNKFVRLIACAAILAAVQSFVLAQQLDPTQPGALYGYTATDLDTPQVTGNRLFRIRLTDGVAVQRGLTGVSQEQEGFLSTDNGTVSRLFGVGETPDTTSLNQPSNFVDLTAPAVNPNLSGTQINFTGINFGTEAGSAWDWLGNNIYSVASDDQTRVDPVTGQQYPASQLFRLNSQGLVIEAFPVVLGRYIDGLAFGANGIVYGTDCRLTDRLYRYNFDLDTWVVVGDLNAGEDLAEDSGLATYRGVNGNTTTLYLITEGEGPARMGRLWRVSNDAAGNPTGQLNLIAPIIIGATGLEAPEDLEGFDIPYLPLAGQQPE
jgi:hypothetical protein